MTTLLLGFGIYSLVRTLNEVPATIKESGLRITLTVLFGIFALAYTLGYIYQNISGF